MDDPEKSKKGQGVTDHGQDTRDSGHVKVSWRSKAEETAEGCKQLSSASTANAIEIWSTVSLCMTISKLFYLGYSQGVRNGRAGTTPSESVYERDEDVICLYNLDSSTVTTLKRSSGLSLSTGGSCGGPLSLLVSDRIELYFSCLGPLASGTGLSTRVA